MAYIGKDLRGIWDDEIALLCEFKGPECESCGRGPTVYYGGWIMMPLCELEKSAEVVRCSHCIHCNNDQAERVRADWNGNYAVRAFLLDLYPKHPVTVQYGQNGLHPGMMRLAWEQAVERLVENDTEEDKKFYRRAFRPEVSMEAWQQFGWIIGREFGYEHDGRQMVVPVVAGNGHGRKD